MRGPVNETAGKVWGKTNRLFEKQSVEVHHIHTKKGGYCSRHLHRHKQNMFYVLKGRLAVEVWKGNLVDTTILGPGEMTTVAAGDIHRFHSLEDSEALEIYWVDIDPLDIDRQDTGGMGNPNDRIEPG